MKSAAAGALVLAAFVLGWVLGRNDALRPGPSGYPSVCFEPAKGARP